MGRLMPEHPQWRSRDRNTVRGKGLKRYLRFLGLALLLAAASVTAGSSSNTTLPWAWANPRPSSDAFSAIAYGGGVYVAVGMDGVIYSSSDGSQWSARSGGLGVGVGDFGFAGYEAVAYGNNRFVAIGMDANGNEHADVSKDGVAWSDQIISTPQASIFLTQYIFLGAQMLYGNGVFVVMSAYDSAYNIPGNAVLTSADGLSWQQSSIGPSSARFFNMAFAAGKFAALGNNGQTGEVVYVSSDGSNWSPTGLSVAATQFSNIVLNVIASAGPGFVVYGFEYTPGCGCGLLYTSPDGISWTQQTAPSVDLVPTLWDGKRFLTSSGYDIYSSPDGVTWSKIGTEPHGSFFPTYPAQVVAPQPGAYVAVCGGLSVCKSSDFVNWTTAFDIVSAGPQANLSWATYQNGKYFATGSYGTTNDAILESDDGLNWAQVYDAPGTPSLTTTIPIAFGNGTYVAIGSSGNVLLSSDGISWSADATPPPDHMADLAFGNGTFLMSGGACQSGCTTKIYTSPDGITWTPQDLTSVTSGFDLGGAVFTGSRFLLLSPQFNTSGVISSGNAVLYTSTDGLSWTQGFVFPTAVQISNLTVAGGQTLAVGSPASVFTSADGLSWSSGQVNGITAPFGGGATLQSITYTGSSYYGVTSTFDVEVSSDAQNWSLVSGLPGNFLFAQNGRLYVVGANGGVMVAEPGAASAQGGTVTSNADNAVQGTLTITGTATAPLTYSVVAVPAHGSATVTDAATGAFTYTPAAGYSGTDQFTFAVDDGITQSRAVETVNVTAAPVTPTPPTGSSNSGGGGGGEGLLALAGLLALRRSRLRQRRQVSR